ncbi:hypothetical protein RYMV_satRNA_gp2 [Rice yellow mottle virus satellite]|uniref:hypothetical protein n=1 Tax=Rice yellow mottle virus satellite TaxID=195056 RepID=UPI000845E3EE|nr:hypothetical protein RYMV_satRNA_gp2 [Rice yellow mottle virus satellite]
MSQEELGGTQEFHPGRPGRLGAVHRASLWSEPGLQGAWRRNRSVGTTRTISHRAPAASSCAGGGDFVSSLTDTDEPRGTWRHPGISPGSTWAARSRAQGVAVERAWPPRGLEAKPVCWDHSDHQSSCSGSFQLRRGRRFCFEPYRH